MDVATQEGILLALQAQGVLSAQEGEEMQKTVAEGSDLHKILVGSNKVNEEQYTKAYAAHLGVPYVDVREGAITKEVLDIIPESTAREHLIIAYDNSENVLKVAMANPSDRQIIEFVHKKVDKPVEVAMASAQSIRDALAKYRAALEVELGTLIEQAKGAASTEEDLSKVAEDLPIINIVDAILRHAILQGASDIHIEPTENKIHIRYRIDGMLRHVLELPHEVQAALVARIKILSNLKIDEHRLPQDGRFKIEADEYKVAFRVSTLPVYNGEKVVMRLLDESGQGLMLDSIGMSKKTLEIFRRNIDKPQGMVLVTGPTGSGKTTTLYAAMREVNKPDVNISTIEDPIEYRMESINQTQVQPQIGLTFASGLRALVRQDPDIIMVGEIRDQETASLAINAALTGHLVFSTLHTNSAAGAVPRLVDMGVEPFLIASTTNLLLAQRLVRQLCQDCKKETPLDEAVIDSLSSVIDLDRALAMLREQKIIQKDITWKTVQVYTAVSCDKCNEGYRGRQGIYEAIEVTPEIQKLITGNVTSQQIEDEAVSKQSMVSMVEDGLIKAFSGITTIEEVLRVAKE